MQAYPVARHAALAIVHRKKLVYARGYTLAEPSWPEAEPTTRFRIASVSKTVTALAVVQLIERKRLALSDTLQSVLQLKTPAGGAPSDPRFSKITIQHLLEHRSGLAAPRGSNSDAKAERFNDGGAVVQAFKAAGHPASLPVRDDDHVASLQLVNDPGLCLQQLRLLPAGRVVAHL
jgi:CubicO group peptidase (beta-lactamase class C family)